HPALLHSYAGLPYPHSFPTRRSSDLPSMPLTTRLCCPLHHRPTSSRGPPYLRNTESSITGVSCQRLRVAGLIDWVRRQMAVTMRSEEHTSELQSRFDLVCRLLLEKKK